VNTGASASIVIYMHGIDSIEQYTYRKYMWAMWWQTIPTSFGVTQWIPFVQFVIHDGGIGDSDWLANGIIQDPGWLAKEIPEKRSGYTKATKKDTLQENSEITEDQLEDAKSEWEKSQEHNSAFTIDKTGINRQEYFTTNRKKEANSNLGNIAQNLLQYNQRRQIKIINTMINDKIFVNINRLNTWNHMLFFSLLEEDMARKEHSAAGSLIQKIQWNIDKFSNDDFQTAWLKKESIEKSISYIIKHY
jgi:hypothetical protein